MDMTIQIEGGKIITTIYAKPTALYQYIPPNSCHPPVVLTGLIYGQILRIYQLSRMCIPFSIPVPAGRHFLESAEFRSISGFRRNTRRNKIIPGQD